MAEKITIAELDLDTTALIASASKTKKEIDALKESQKQLSKEGEKGSAQFVENEVALKKLSTSYGKQKNTLVALTDENNKFISTEQATNEALNKNVTTINGARDSNKELLAIRGKLNLSTEQGKQELDQINGKLDENNAFIKDNVSAYEQQKIGIGDYEGALRKVFPASGALIDGLKNAKEGLIGQKVAMQGATAGTSGTTKALKLFRIALIATGIGAIVVVLGSLIGAFASTQKGADAISKALAPIKGAFQGIIGVVQNISLNVFGQLGDRFTIVSGTILNGIDRIRIGWNKISGDTEEAEAITKRLAERTLEIEKAQVSLNKKTEAFSEIIKGAGKAISDSAKAQQDMVNLGIQIERAEIRLVKQRAISLRTIKEQKKISEDLENTQEVREQALKKAMQESQKLLKAEQGILDLKINQMKIEQTQNDTSREGKLELANLQAERINKETQAITLETTLVKKLGVIKKEIEASALKDQNEKTAKLIEDANIELEIFKQGHLKKIEAGKFFNDTMLQQEKDRINAVRVEEEKNLKFKLDNGVISQKEYDLAINAVKTESQAREDEANTLRDEAEKERQAVDLINKRTIDEENFLSRYEIELGRLELQKQAELDSAVKSGADIDLINQKYNKRKINLDNASTEAKISNAQNTLGAIGGLLNKESVAGKAVALAQAGINVQQGITKAIAQGGLAGIVTGAIVAVKGGMAIGKILSSDTPKFEKGGLQGVGGKRHSSGGTKFVGEDGTRFEAERGEIIGVMSRQASEKFMDFNNRYTDGTSFGNSLNLGKFETGGTIAVGSNPSISDSNMELAKMISGSINGIKVVAIVDDIAGALDIQTQITDGANV
tara:strand:- start:784 stop:3315 length:2532 start_codon:yes stop_codon:yes gene_type:complete